MKTTKNRNAQRNAKAISKRKKHPIPKPVKTAQKKIPLKRPFVLGGVGLRWSGQTIIYISR
ncbi:hypothetical protein [Pseudomonas sp. FW300-N2F2]|uniref:hypothetical protein n=1 Tax=Pseudomonas sp. FW300-N2F2 TaxID=2751320 RepID=UPI001A916860|nr:hypothetical protein [Pseudomonas sp. FW300-N2F2]